MKKFITFLFLVSILNSFSQEAPIIKINDSSQLKIVDLNIDVKIVGNFSITTYNMKFFNELDRTLEGELLFPLGEGQSVSRFAMDVNGKLREAVIVEKELARIAFESTVRQNIDPGLLEKTQGNNYKARIYPILPNSYKQIVIAYEQELFINNSSHLYELPLGFNEILSDFSLKIEVFSDQGMPIIRYKNPENLIFLKKNNTYIAEVNKSNHIPSNPIIVGIPIDKDTEKVITYNNYFYAYKTLKPNSRLKEKPNSIALFWDSSLSVKHRDLDSELKLLGDYFNYLQNVEVQFISFSNTFKEIKNFSIINSDWTNLKDHIKSVKYDGGTTLDLLKNKKIKSDEIMLFSDGLSNLGSLSNSFKGAIYTINSKVSANHEALKNIATKSGGNYINLVRLSFIDAVKLLKNETFQFLGVKQDDSINDFYPFKNINVVQDFSISGIFSGENTTIELLFGYQNKVTERIQIAINSSENTKIVKRLWAQKKLRYLNEEKSKNKEAIIELALQNNLVTDYTSMLILDRIEDYVRYRIEPPEELKKEYKERISNIEEKEAEELDLLKKRKEGLFEDYQDIMDWYNTVYPKKKIKKNKKQISSNENRNRNNLRNLNAIVPNRNNISNRTILSRFDVDSTKRIINGIILDNSGLPLPGVNIIIKNSNNGVQSNFDGYYALNAEEQDVLAFTYVGFITVNAVVGNSNTINVSLNEDSAVLEEVVVTAQGIKREKKALGYAVSDMITQSLQGKSAGINTPTNDGLSGAISSIKIRGASSITNSDPLYIIDGVPEVSIHQFVLTPDKIESFIFLKPEEATKLYGTEGSNGVIIITTKNGLENNFEEIEKLNKLIDDKIEIKSWDSDTPYIKILEKEPTIESAYIKYFELRDQYSNSPTFYLDVSDFFDKRNERSIAITILTNLIEIELDNYELLKALAYKLEYFKEYELAVFVYQKALELRPEEPQSYRDLALVYEYIGEYQKSFDLLYLIYNGELLEKDVDERYYGIEHIAFVELNRLISKYDKKLKLNKGQKNNFKEIPVDIRVVVDWNHNDTDIDLWVIDPNNEKGYYQNSLTKIGGRLSEDLIEGYGPEEYMLKKAIKGEYKIMVDYFSDNVQKISGPTILKITLFTNYGKKNESKQTTIVRLDEKEDEIEVGKFKY